VVTDLLLTKNTQNYGSAKYSANFSRIRKKKYCSKLDIKALQRLNQQGF
jgi:hypothetical protein